MPLAVLCHTPRLPQEDLKKCLDGLIDLERRKTSLKKPTNFYEWLENRYEAMKEVRTGRVGHWISPPLLSASVHISCPPLLPATTSFGRGIMDIFLVPYNQKVRPQPYDHLSPLAGLPPSDPVFPTCICLCRCGATTPRR